MAIPRRRVMVSWQRFSPLAGVAAVAAMVTGFGLTSGTPATTDDDARIESYFNLARHHSRLQVGFVVFLVGVLLLLFFFSTLRVRIVARERGPGRLGALVWGAGVASAVVWLTAFALLNGAGFAVDDTSRFKIDANTYRLTSDIGYELWISAVVLGSLIVWAASAAALRTGLFPRWFAWVGVAVGVILLFAIFFIPVFVYWAWLLVASLLLTWDRTTDPSELDPGGKQR
jgi:hypothetical protein